MKFAKPMAWFLVGAAGVACASIGNDGEPLIEPAPDPDEGPGDHPPDPQLQPDPEGSDGGEGDEEAPTILPEALVSGTNSPRGVAADASFVYFGSISDNAIYKVPLLGGAASRVDTGATVKSPWVYAVDDKYVWFANITFDDGAVARVPKTGGAAQILVSNVRPWGMTIDATNVYFTDQTLSSDGSIKRVAKSCAAPCTATTMVPGQEFPMGIATDGTYVYWGNHAADVTYAYPGGPETSRTWKGTLRRWPVSTTTTDPDAETLLSDLHLPGGVAVTGGRAFVATIDDESVHAIEIETKKETVIPSVGEGYFMTADDTNVYWLTGGAIDQASLYRMRFDSNVPTSVASNQEGPIGITVGDDAVFWANNKGGQIMRLAK